MDPEYYIKEKDGYCEVMVNSTHPSNYHTVFGQPFFKAFNPVFDLDHQRIGFMGNIIPIPRLTTKNKRRIYAFGSIGMILIFGGLFMPTLNCAEKIVGYSEEYHQLKR
mmetsp:Transcript_34305/g.33525  ORF Transcript_34305/g.33525 Transcript_34305/m.33525 type:complete len:108 (-) Transcript_34305:229-552(-)